MASRGRRDGTTLLSLVVLSRKGLIMYVVRYVSGGQELVTQTSKSDQPVIPRKGETVKFITKIGNTFSGTVSQVEHILNESDIDSLTVIHLVR